MFRFCVYLSLFVVASCYKPVIMFHGYSGSNHDFDTLIGYINKYHNGTTAISLDLFNGMDSYTPMWDQVKGVAQAIVKLNFSSYHLMCHSQGALVCRTVLEVLENSNVDHYISLSGPHMGQYGLIDWLQKDLPNITLEYAYLLLYKRVIQDLYSAANYWNDPYHQPEYLAGNIFLPIMNNQTFNPNSKQYKENFLNTQLVALFGSPADGVIQPWESAFFGYWNQSHKIVPMKDQEVYIEDYFGLKTLDQEGRLLATQVAGVEHTGWLFREDLFVKYLEPLLT